MPRRSVLRGDAGSIDTHSRASIYIHGLHPRVEAAVRFRAKEWADVIASDTGHDLLRQVQSHASRVLAIVLGRDDGSSERIPALVRALRTARVDAPILAVCRLGPEYSAEICALGAAGVQELIFEDAEAPFSNLRNTVASAARQCAADVVLARLGRDIPGRVRPFIEQCLGRGGSRPIADIARSMGRDRSQLFRYCWLAGLPSPKATRGWCRLMLTAHLLESTPRTAESISEELDFASVTSMRNLLHRYVNLTTNQLRDQGLRHVIDSFRQACTTPPDQKLAVGES